MGQASRTQAIRLPKLEAPWAQPGRFFFAGFSSGLASPPAIAEVGEEAP